MSVRPDNRLSDAPMAPVTCMACSASVLARKSSWEQTSVQWDAAARRLCRYPSAEDTPTQAADSAKRYSGWLAMCPQLRASIEAAVGDGSLRVLNDDHDDR